MIPSINTVYPFILIIPIIVITVIAVYFLYFRKLQSENLTKFQLNLLTIIRFVVLVLIGFLLLNPILKLNKFEFQKPLMVVAVDNSASMMLNNDSLLVRDSLIPFIKKEFEIDENDFEYKLLSFGDTVSFNYPDFDDTETNYEQLFNTFNSTFFNQNIGCLVLISDGIYNKGVSPKYASQNISFPIYSIPVGDTNKKADLSVIKVEYNSVVYKGSKFPIEVGVNANLLENEKVKVEIYRDNILIQSKEQLISSPNYFSKVRFSLAADTAGVFKYEVRLKTNQKELNVHNNHKTFIVDVEEDQRKVLIVQDGYHPDIAVFKTIIENNPAFNVEVVNASNIHSDFSEYACVVLHQLPSKSNYLQNAIGAMVQNNTPILYIVGGKTDVQALNNIGGNIQIEQKNNLFDEVLPSYNNAFNLFNIDISEAYFSELPPLHVPFGNYKKNHLGNVLFYQQVGQLETTNPLWVFSNNGKQKTGFIFGEGLWKWRIQEYRKFNNHSITNELVMKTIQYLATKRKVETFTVDYQRVYKSNQSIDINAALHNASNEQVKNANIQLSLFDSEGRKYPHVFKEHDEGYRLNLGLLSKGKYSFTAQTEYDNSVYKKSGTFIVNENQIEQSNLVANFEIMHQLSNQTNGKVISKHNPEQLMQEIKNNGNINTIKYSHQSLLELINLKVLLMVLILLLVVEWFLRKYWGLV